MLDVKPAQVGDGEGLPLDVVRLHPALTGPLDHVSMGLCHGGEWDEVGVFADDVDQALVQRHGDPDVDVVVPDDRVAVERRVEVRELAQGQRRRFDNQVVHRDFIVGFPAGVKLFAQGHRRAHVDLDRDVEVRYGGLALDHARPDPAPNPGCGDLFAVRPGNERCVNGSRGSRSGPGALLEGFDVGAHDAPHRTAAFHSGQIHVLLGGKPPSKRAGAHTSRERVAVASIADGGRFAGGRGGGGTLRHRGRGFLFRFFFLLGHAQRSQIIGFAGLADHGNRCPDRHPVPLVHQQLEHGS